MKENLKINAKSSVIVTLLLLVSISISLTNCSGYSKDKGVDIEGGFLNPPESAKPRVWWHWMNGNITKEGIKADLEWMKRAGIGGFQNFDASLGTPQIVKKRLIYMTPEWKEAFHYATTLADSLGLEMAIAGSPGWSQSGGPWVPPSQAMKKYVWSEIRINGGQPFRGDLPKPPSVTGPFRNIASKWWKEYGVESTDAAPVYYADAAVVAYRVPENDKSMEDLKPKVTSSGGKFELIALTDGDLAQSTLLPAAPVGEKAWIRFEFEKPETIQSITIFVVGEGVPGNVSTSLALEASDDGRQFRTISEIPVNRLHGWYSRNLSSTITFPPETARFFRFTVSIPALQTNPAVIRSAAFSGVRVAELVLHTVARVNRFEDKAGFNSVGRLDTLATPPIQARDAIRKDDIIDLTSKMSPDGKLNWTPPDGQWVVLRLGYSLTGQQNRPASFEATGLEVDKLNPDYVKAYFDNYLDQYKDATGGLMGERGLRYVITDSWEAGLATWTNNIMTEFSNRRGYSMLPWLPVLTGHVVESSESSDSFLWDFRKTLEELLTEYHYDNLTTILHQRGMGRYSEAHEWGRVYIADGMEIKRTADIPMSAMWTPGSGGNNEKEAKDIDVPHKADVRESASVAHIYGQNLVAAESMTARNYPWGFSPEKLKPTADMLLACGLNLFVIHTSVHQPVDDKIPGLSLGRYGQWFTRHETWSEQALPWTTYLARSCFMLQQGKFVADVIYLYGEDNNITSLFFSKLPEVPEGYEFDFINTDALVNILSVKKGHITTPGGMSYRLLALDPSTRFMSLHVLKKIRDMVNAGAMVVGPKPVNTPSLSDSGSEFQAIADALWGAGTGIQTFGEGKVYTDQTIAEVLNTLQIEPDFKYTKPRDNTKILYVHRKLADSEIYWVNNRNNYVENLEATFRVAGKAPEIWHPETGVIEKASYKIAGSHTSVPLHLEANDAVFVVFRGKAREQSRTIARPVETQLSIIEGPWDVTFQSNRGAPAQITLEKLAPWNENADPGVKYFSGRGTYIKTIQAPPDWFRSGAQLWLDLGNVKDLAEVIVNGQSLGIIWKTPFRINVTRALKEGANTLEVKVTNLWVNRLVGDEQPGAKKYTYTYKTPSSYEADSPLLPSGLLGPVKIVSASIN